MMKINLNATDEEAKKYIEQKGHKLTFNYDEIKKSAHHKAFTVAKAMRNDLLLEIHDSLVQSRDKGTSFGSWKKELKPTLAKRGWLGKVEVTNPSTGEVAMIDVNNHRLRTIYNTNMKTSSAVARYKEMNALTRSVYWKYIAICDDRTRKSHEALNGKIFHKDHEFWKQNYPPNAWGCRCKVIALTLKEAEAEGYTPDKDMEIPKNYAPHPDWAYNVGDTDKLMMSDKIDIKGSGDEFKTIFKDKKLDALTDDQLKQKFYKNLGIKEGETFIDKVGDPIVINSNLFSTGSGASKIKKSDRHLYLDEFANVIKEPDEIYLDFQKLNYPSDKYYHSDKRLVKRMFKYYQNEKGQKRAIVAIFEYMKNKTCGATIYLTGGNKTIDNKRSGKLIYKK